MACPSQELSVAVDEYWTAVAKVLERLAQDDDLILAPNEFLPLFPGVIALHVRKRMLPQERIAHFALHKGMLEHVDPAYLAEAAGLTAVFANEVFAVYSIRGEELSAEQCIHLPDLSGFRAPPLSTATGVLVTTYNRSAALQRSLASIARQGRPILVVDDGSAELVKRENERIAVDHGAVFLGYPVNHGLANAMNVGVSYWLGCPEIEWISIFNDDVEVVDGTFDVIDALINSGRFVLDATVFTGFESALHPLGDIEIVEGHAIRRSNSSSGQHLHARSTYWQGVLPVPTTYPRAPKPTGGVFPGHGGDTDWWVASWAPRAAPKLGGNVVVVPGLVNTFSFKDSTWGNDRLQR